MAKFHLEIDENDRFTLVLSLSHKIACGNGVGVVSAEYADYLNLMRRLLEAPPSLPRQGQVSAHPREGESPAVTAPVSDSPRPARSSVPSDPDVMERTFRADSITKVGNRLVVKWQERDKILQASCWETKLFPAVLATVTREATYLIKAVKKGNATYLNVVGVK